MVEWKQDRCGGGSTANLGNGLTLSVQWTTTRLPTDEPHYEVYALGCQLKNRSHTSQDGQKRAEAFAKKILSEALAKLD